MSMVRRSPITIIIGVLPLLVAAAAAYGFAVFNPLTTTSQTGSIVSAAAYTVNNISYTLDAQNPHLIAQVSFTISPATIISANTTVQAKLHATSTTYAPCSNISATTGTWQCTFSGVTVAAADQLDVRVLPLQPDGPYVVRLPLIRGPQSFNRYLPRSIVDQHP